MIYRNILLLAQNYFKGVVLYKKFGGMEIRQTKQGANNVKIIFAIFFWKYYFFKNTRE